MTDRRGQRVVRNAGEPGAEFFDVRAGAGDVGAVGLASAQVGVVVRGRDAVCFGAVEDAVQAASGVDLEQGVLEQFSGLAAGEEELPSEFLDGSPDSSFQFVGGRSAEVSARFDHGPTVRPSSGILFATRTTW